MTDVRQQLTEALDEVEKLARDAIQAAACGCHIGADTSRWLWEGGDSVQVDNGTGHSVITGASWGSTFLDDRTGTWIARWDPATVLRLVERDRATLADIGQALDEGRAYDVHVQAFWLAGRELQRMAAFWLGTPEADR